MSRFHSLQVKDIKRETPLAISIAFEVPEALSSDYQFQSGQYVTFKTIINGEEIRRSYSISSSPSRKELRVVVKAVENGVFSNYAKDHLKVGDVLEVGIPEGKFIVENTDAKIFAAFAAGSGITPVISIIRDVLEKRDDTTFILIYGNKTQEDTIYFNEINALQQQYLGRFFVHYTFTKTHPEGTLFGRIERATVNFVLKNKHSRLSKCVM